MSRNTRRIILLVLLILLLAAGLRMAAIDAQSLWYDEGLSAGLAIRSLTRITRDAAADIHPPGYYILLAGWEDLAGRSVLSLRMLSAYCGILTAAVVYAVGRRFFDRWTGLIAALLVAVNPFQVWYGQEARMYALLGLLSAASVLLTAAVLRIPGEMSAGNFRPARAGGIISGFILVNAAGLYTHYTFPFIMVAESLVFLIWLLGRPKKLHGLITWIVINVATLLLFAPWLPTAIRAVTNWPHIESGAVGLVEMAGVIAYGQTVPARVAQAALIPLLLLVVVGLFPPVESESRYLRFSERIGLIALWLLVPIAIPMAMGVIRGPYLKFFVPVNLALMLLAARGVVMGVRLSAPFAPSSEQNTWLSRLILVILAGSAFFPAITGLSNLYANPDYARDNYKGIASRIRAEAGDNAAVVLTAPTQIEVFGYYYPLGDDVRPLPLSDVDTGAVLDNLITRHNRIYAIFWAEDEQDPGRSVEQALNARASIADSQWYGRVRLVTYVVPAEPASAPDTLSDARFGQHITLEGYALSSRQLAPGDALAVTLFWSTDAPLDARYKVFAHLYYPDGSVAAQHDGEPGGGILRTDTWTPGDTVIDNHGLLLPVDAPPSDYTLMVGVYDFDGTRLPVASTDAAPDDRLLLEEIRIGPN
jgi:4-amino-4-deoxy-L-arabinose transferase-like glycosyltransferase